MFTLPPPLEDSPSVVLKQSLPPYFLKSDNLGQTSLELDSEEVSLLSFLSTGKVTLFEISVFGELFSPEKIF